MQSFSRAQLASGLATGADFGLLFLLTEFFHVWYVPATAAGAASGAIVNFMVNRHWSFSATHDIWHSQAIRYAIVSAGSLLLNTGGTYFVTEFAHVHYSVSVISVSIIIGFLFNYPLQRGWVFK